jgi:hypothetical protein
MKSKLADYLAALLIVGIHFPAQAQTPVDPVRPISTITEGYLAKYNTIAHELLNNEAASSKVTQDMYDFIDSVVDEAQRRIAKKANYSRDEAVGALRVIDEILIARNVVYPADTAGMGLVAQFSDGLRGRTMNTAEIDALAAHRHNKRRSTRIREHAAEPFYVNDCDTTSFLYLAIADVIQLPLYLVELPGHNFVRFDDGAISFDWETMDAVVAPPDYYKTLWRIPQALILERVYLATMNRADVLGYHFSITADIWAKKNADQRSFNDDAKAAALYPRGPRVWNQIAWHLVAAHDPNLRDGPIALENAKKAISISRTPNLLDTMACAYAQMKEFDLAVEVEKEGRDLYPTGNYPAEVEVPDFAEQLQLFAQHKTCAEISPAALASMSKKGPANLSHIINLD